ncbi:MAG: TonB-dependent receptor, partial [Colwellia sp.]|nr:TonB-dependent receptor [Colwellia sp.]
DRKFNVDSDTGAVFAQFDYKFSEQWEATLGLRYSNEDKDGYRKLLAVDPTTRTPVVEMPLIKAPAIAQAFPNGLPGPIYSAVVLAGQNIYDHEIQNTRNEGSFTPALNIKYKMDDAMIYASVSTGSKAGGFDSRSNNPDDFEFEDESVTSFELGSKFTLDDGLADINIALFSMLFEDLQTSVYDGSTGFFVENGAKATSMGIELDGRWAFADNWLVNGSLGFLDFEWDDYTGAKCFSSVSLVPDNIEENGTSCDMSGKTNALAPKLSGSISLEYYTEIADAYELKANLDVLYKSEYYTNGDLNPFTKQDAFAKLNARVAFMSADNTWQVAILGKNLTDETTVSFATDMALIGPGFYGVRAEEGRSVSLQFSYNFE